MEEVVGRDAWKCWIKELCARIECRDSLVRNIGDVIMAVAVLLAVFGVDAMEMRAVEVW